MTYGANAPAITPQYSGFENGDSASSLSSLPACTTTATSASSVSDSPYTSTCSGAVDTNYTITYVPGVVTVNPAPLTITATSEPVTYGANVPPITAQYSGFENGDECLVIERAAHLLDDRPPVRVRCPARRIRPPAAEPSTRTTPSTTCQAW